MLGTRLRTRPWRARWRKSSDGRSKTSAPSFCFTVISAGSVRSSLPFGPSTATFPGASVTFTLLGTWIGSFPIRDNFFLYLSELPDVREDFAAKALAGGLPAAHYTLGGAEDGDAETSEDPRDLGLARVDAQSGAADPLHARDHAGAVRAGLEDDTHRLRRSVGLHVVARDVALVLQDAGDLELQARRRDLDLGVPRGVGVADARQHVGDRVADDSRRGLLDGLGGCLGDCCSHHQLAFVTPGTRPSEASSRKQMRHMPNLRRNARGRPQMRQRL